MDLNKNLERKDIDIDYTWDVDSMYKDQEAWDLDYSKLEEALEAFKSYQGKLATGQGLLDGLRARDEIYRRASNLYSYASLKLDQDTRDSQYQALADKAYRAYVNVDELTSFFIPEVLGLDWEQIQGFIGEKPELGLYEKYLREVLRRKKHILSPREEEILAKVGEISSSSEDVFSMLNNADLKFPKMTNEEGQEIEITHGNYIPLMMSDDRRVRKEAFEKMYSVYRGLKNSFASLLDGEIKSNKFYAEMRNYDSSLEASLDKNNISKQVYENLIASVHENLEPMYKYIDLRKKAMGLDEIHMYDIYNPIVEEQDFDYEFEDAKGLIAKALAPLGEDYLKIVDEGFNSRWIDVYENVGKRSGGYSGGSYDSKPFILLNYKNSIDSVFTLAHEMGHSIHSYLSRENQEFIYANYSIFVAEVASTVNEVLLINYLLGQARSDSEKIYLLGHFIDSFRATLYRQTMFAEFEQMINRYVKEKGGLTADYLNKSYRELNSLYFGPNMVLDEEIDSEWSRIPHFYYNFYVYQYATGYSAAVAIANKILSGEEGILEKYLEFLSSGSSDYPLDSLKKLGINMESKEPVDKALEIFADLVDQMEGLLDKAKK